MNVAVKHNGTTITGFLVSYNREHRICTGIGTLTITLDGTIPRTFDPWDTIDIHENGDFKVRYYISEVRHSVPEGTITLECQDKSKQLVDYFIPDSYTIDYPSHTRFWIEKFLDEAGISYEFETTSQGQLLSNYTALGLQPAYDQIMNLLQLSGWYMFFDGNGKAIIGPLSTNLADSAGSVGKTDILQISRVTDDKMLRNRAVVWGQFNPITEQYAFADISTHTQYNYDHNDKRAMVIANSNIPNRSSAYSIANILLKEFAKPTIEKHLVVHGARDYNLGEALKVGSDVWRGKGLITTFGVTLDRNGLVTNIVLDERCPRLFGFFNFGDYVYVGTFGDGVWRKHLQFDPAWYNFSSGLTNLNITDLHINNGVFGAVGHSGEPFYAFGEDDTWNRITITGLDSSLEDTVGSGGMITYAPFSGIMARATIVDKITNNVKFGVDTWSGLNTGDYFLTFSGFSTTISGVTFSGVSISGGHRGWIVEYDPSTGLPVGGLGSGIYPIHYSGNYNIMVLDLENDGRNDYVSVRTGGSNLIPGQSNYQFGQQVSAPFFFSRDPDAEVLRPLSSENIDNNNFASLATNLPVVDFGSSGRTNSIIAIDKPNADQRIAMSIGKNGDLNRLKITRDFDIGSQTYQLNSSGVFKAGGPADPSFSIIGIHPEPFLDKYTIFYTDTEVTGSLNFYYKEWDAVANTLGSQTLITTNALQTSGASGNVVVSLNGFIYYMHLRLDEPPTVGGDHLSPTTLYIDLVKINKSLRTAQTIQVLRYSTPADGGSSGASPTYFYMSEGAGVIGNDTNFGLFQKGSDIQIIGWTHLKGHNGTNFVDREIVWVGNETIIQNNQIYEDTDNRFGSVSVGLDINGMQKTSCQVTTNEGFIALIEISPGTNNYPGFIFDGLTFKLTNGRPFQAIAANIFPVFNDPLTSTVTEYIAKSGSDFHKISLSSYESLGAITPPSGYTLRKPFSMCINSTNTVYFQVRENASFETSLVPYSLLSGFDFTGKLTPNAVPLATTRGTNFGGWFISEPTSYTVSNPTTEIRYLDLGEVEGPPGYLILQREGSDYNLIQQASKPMRVDISNNSPVLSVQDLENTFVSNFVYLDSVTQIIPVSGLLTKEVRDYRYTMLEMASGVVVASGEPIAQVAIYINPSGIFISDTATYSGGFAVMDIIPSGERIETSNFTYPGQYIFATTSGLNPQFYQRDPGSLIFDTYSGLPDSRVTIIRLDDRI